MTTKEFPTLVVASTITGVALCRMPGYGPILECAAHLLGGPVWTHELVHGPTQDAYCEEGRRQFPDMPSRIEVRENWEAAARKAVERYGETVQVAEGTHGRREDPTSTAHAVVKGSRP